jgi:hypothetical protein
MKSKFVWVPLLALFVPASAPAFLLHYTLQTQQGTFVYNLVDEPDPHWTLTLPGEPEVVYEGQAFDSAKFSGELSVSFSDEISITRNGADVVASLKGKISSECGKAKITLKDETNGVQITLDAADAAVQSCSGNL